MKTKKKKERIKDFPFLAGSTLASLIKDVKEAGYKRSEFDRIVLSLDYSECYYPDEQPGIEAKFQ